jgi:hydroxymethylpyrimidine/phosphomethylpyrimidine kinase
LPEGTRGGTRNKFELTGPDPDAAWPSHNRFRGLKGLWHIHLKLRDPHDKRHPRIRQADESTFRHAIQTDDVIAVVGEPFPRPQARVFPANTVSLDHYLLAGLISNYPFPASNRNRFDRLIVDRDKVRKRVRPVRRRFERRHINNFVDDHAKIGQFPKHRAHLLQCAMFSEKSFSMETPVAVSIAGSDNSSGAGIQADLKTFTHFKVYAETVVTCVVAEVPGKVLSIQPVEQTVVRDQLNLSLVHFPVLAIKTGMLYSREIIDLVCETYEAIPTNQRPYLVVDPVMVATSGDPLVRPDAIERYKSRMFPLASLITPNLHEASTILGTKLDSLSRMRDAASELYQVYQVPILLKGGHLKSTRAIDVLVDSDGVHEYSEPFRKGVSTHGTGCTYSAAIAANLAFGRPLKEAVTIAKEYVTRAINDAFRWTTVGGETSALRHFWS